MVEMQNGDYARVNGLEMYYEIHGEGEPLLLLHGGGSSIGTTFGMVLPWLAAKFKIIAVDLQAHGHSGDRDAPETFRQDADDVVALLQHLGIAKANIFGFSNGGQTAMQIGISYPEKVDKLVIASAFYKRTGIFDGFFEMMKGASLENMPKQLQEAYLALNPDPVKLENMHNKDRDRMLAFADWTDDDLRSIEAPVLLVIGNRDIVSPEHAVTMSRLIPNAELMIVPGNHGSFIGEICSTVVGSRIPELTITAIVEFLELPLSASM